MLKTYTLSDKAQALKSYNADTGKLTVLDETTGSGSSSYDFLYQLFANVYIVKAGVIYTKNWQFSQNYSYQDPNQKISIIVSDLNGTKKSLKDIPATYTNSYVGSNPYEPGGIYFATYTDGKATYYEYEDGALKSLDITDDTYNSSYSTYLFSPDNNKTFWYEIRNGKNTLFVGDQDGKSTLQITTLSDYKPYGWYGNDYIVLSKNGSELYIASSSKALSESSEPLKIGTFQSTANSYRGYGTGYGASL